MLCSIFAFVGLLLFAPQNTFAVPDSDPINPDTTIVAPDEEVNTGTAETTDTESATGPVTDAACYDQVGGIGWLICPTTGTLAKGIDAIYGWLENLLIVNPISTDRDSPVYLVWEYIRNITNIVFIIFLLVVIYSQLTGLGISNYGIKSVLPRIIIAAILVNLSFILCAIAVDLSNILGTSLKGVFDNVQAATTVSSGTHAYSAGEIAASILGGGAGAVAIAGVAYFSGAIFLLVPVIFAGIIAVLTAFIVMAARHALIVLLLIVSPLALVAYLLPNTESWFNKWKDLFLQMLVFYPMFAVLFGASQLASWVIFASATNAAGETNFLGIILGIAVQLLPLFFALSLMKMSNTVLGSISTGIQRLTSPAQQGLDSWARSEAAAHRASKRNDWLKSNSMLTGSRAANWFIYRKKLRELNTADNEKTVQSRATIKAHQKISGGFDANDPEKTLRANKYTRDAKNASTISARADTAATDTAGLLGAYKTHYIPKGRSKPKGLLDVRRISAIDNHFRKIDERLNEEGGQAYLHANRAAITAESNEEADWAYLHQTFTEAANGGPDSYNYKRWLLASAGELGPAGVSSVLGQVIFKAATAEQRRRKYDHILLDKYGHNKRDFRNMTVGYYVDDDGFATDEKGKLVTFWDPVQNKHRPELVPGELLLKDPSKLVRYNLADENGKLYYDWKDQQGNFLMRVYREDVPFMKEAFSNYDIPINDPINSLYSILAGMYPNEHDGIGLANFSTTLGRALQSAHYKEKTAGMGAQAIASISRRQIKNHAQLGIELLDNIVKTGKANNFNTQDAIHIQQLNAYLDPTNWPILFPEEGVMGYVNVNGKPLEGLDDDGNSVPADIATYEQKMNKIKEKYLFPAVNRFPSFLSRFTANTADNQKPGSGDALDKMKKLIDKYWQGNEAKDAGRIDAYEQKANFIETSREIRRQLQNLSDIIPTRHTDIRFIVDELFGANNDPDEIVATLRHHLGDHPNLGGALQELDEFIEYNPIVSEEELLEKVLDLLEKYLND